MANSKHLAILHEGVQVWNQWRRANTAVQPDLSDANLTKAQLAGADLRGTKLRRSTLSRAQLGQADMREADLYQVEFYRADLQFARLDEADLSGAKFHNSDLRGACLAGTNLYRVDFIGTMLAESDFRRAHCSLTAFAGLDLTASRGLSEIIHDGPSNIDVSTLIRSAAAPLVTFLVAAGVPEALVSYARSLASSPIEFYSCFISHSHADKLFARSAGRSASSSPSSGAHFKTRKVRAWGFISPMKLRWLTAEY